jgi:hypothetical protein
MIFLIFRSFLCVAGFVSLWAGVLNEKLLLVMAATPLIISWAIFKNNTQNQKYANWTEFFRDMKD